MPSSSPIVGFSLLLVLIAQCVFVQGFDPFATDSLNSKFDAASKASIKCCVKEAHLSMECAKSVCRYFGDKNYPDKCTVPIMHNFNQMVACFGAHSDNRACCKRKGVKAPCLDLCNGKNPDYLPDPAYVPCTFPGKVDTAIQQCNHDAWKRG
ncbi:hypothetical protein niasHT_039280 [Heterodera trifolii]|uniref:Domain of unknown function DB domain-containing protein n=1 Tax=Heterodera trifolii TaxID=157864 RepID=A0ABD2IFN8_9BILA